MKKVPRIQLQKCHENDDKDAIREGVQSERQQITTIRAWEGWWHQSRHETLHLRLAEPTHKGCPNSRKSEIDLKFYRMLKKLPYNNNNIIVIIIISHKKTKKMNLRV